MKTLLNFTFTLIFIAINLHGGNLSANSGGLEKGEAAPDFTAIDQNGKSVTLSKKLAEGPVVVIFYRGQWCPLCSRHLGALQDSLHLLTEKGAIVLAVSPEKQEFLQKTAEKANASFTLLYDKDYQIMQDYRVAFAPDAEEKEMYNNRLNAQFEVAHANPEVLLPVPATYIIDTNGKIVFKHYNPDYRVRASVREMLENLPE